MHYLYLSAASEVAPSLTGMFDQLGAHSGGISVGRVQVEKKIKSLLQWQWMRSGKYYYVLSF